jgi:hypothetical protein
MFVWYVQSMRNASGYRWVSARAERVVYRSPMTRRLCSPTEGTTTLSPLWICCTAASVSARRPGAGIWAWLTKLYKSLMVADAPRAWLMCNMDLGGVPKARSS